MSEDRKPFSLFQAGPLNSPSMVIAAIEKLAEACVGQGWNMPPLPPNPARLVPCHIAVTEEDGGVGRTGEISFTHEDGRLLFAAEWTVERR